MIELPPEVLSEIEADVQRYRDVRIKAALRKLNDPIVQNQLHRRMVKERFLNSQDEIVARYVAGESITQLSEDFEVSAPRIKGRISDWIWAKTEDRELRRLGVAKVEDATWDEIYELGNPRYSDAVWRAKIKELSA